MSIKTLKLNFDNEAHDDNDDVIYQKPRGSRTVNYEGWQHDISYKFYIKHRPDSGLINVKVRKINRDFV